MRTKLLERSFSIIHSFALSYTLNFLFVSASLSNPITSQEIINGLADKPIPKREFSCKSRPTTAKGRLPVRLDRQKKNKWWKKRNFIRIVKRIVRKFAYTVMMSLSTMRPCITLQLPQYLSDSVPLNQSEELVCPTLGTSNYVYVQFERRSANILL